MHGLLVRSATRADVATLAVLIGGFRDHLRARSPGDADLAAYLPVALSRPEVEFACAWFDEEPAGYTQTRFFASVWVSGTEAHLEDLFVVPAARGRGVGSALLRFAAARAEERKARRLSLLTNEANAAAQALYRSEGFAPQSHALYPGGREVLWSRALPRAAP
jgi:ribosomal protein S18 acetylase RimI-like enzyme